MCSLDFRLKETDRRTARKSKFLYLKIDLHPISSNGRERISGNLVVNTVYNRKWEEALCGLAILLNFIMAGMTTHDAFYVVNF
jgi:hypothetical protein